MSRRTSGSARRRTSAGSQQQSQRSFLLKIYLGFVCVIWLSVVTFTPFDSSSSVQQVRTFGSKELLLRHDKMMDDDSKSQEHDVSTHHSIRSPTLSTLSKPKKETIILSRDSSIQVTSDVRGNLGPASIILQDPPGKDWIKDRWQAAGDMHGTSIPGQHWVMLDFFGTTNSTNTSSAASNNHNRHISKIVIDWEAAYSNDYRIEISLSDDEGNHSDDSDWCILYDGTNQSHQSKMRTVEEYGQSPGVKTNTPLHVVHTIDLEEHNSNNCPSAFRFLRVFIKSSPTGWGVSIWQLDIYGWLL
eukprot:scaffold73024_cov61-Attheya_sp.AAC.10